MPSTKQIYFKNMYSIIKVYVRKLFKLKNDGKKEYETNPNPL